MLKATSVPYDPPKMVGPSSLKYVIQALLLSPALRNTQILISRLSFLNSDVPASQPALNKAIGKGLWSE